MSRKYEERLENEIECLKYRIVELKNEMVETKYLKDIRYKEIYDRVEKAKMLLDLYKKYDYKEFRHKLAEILRGIY